MLNKKKAETDFSSFVVQSSSSFSDRYVPPPLRRQSQPREEDFFKPNPYLPSLGKNNLASFDRSSAPEPEDSFYTFSNEPSFAFSHFSPTTPSTPNTSRNFSRSFGFSPKGFAASPPLPRAISRPSRLNTPSFERQQVIAEVEEDEATMEVGVPLLPEVDEFDQSEEPLGPVLPLASVREKGTELDLSHLKAVDLGTPVEDCSGCGLVADRSFVVFVSFLLTLLLALSFPDSRIPRESLSVQLSTHYDCLCTESLSSLVLPGLPQLDDQRSSSQTSSTIGLLLVFSTSQRVRPLLYRILLYSWRTWYRSSSRRYPSTRRSQDPNCYPSLSRSFNVSFRHGGGARSRQDEKTLKERKASKLGRCRCDQCKSPLSLSIEIDRFFQSTFVTYGSTHSSISFCIDLYHR